MTSSFSCSLYDIIQMKSRYTLRHCEVDNMSESMILFNQQQMLLKVVMEC